MVILVAALLLTRIFSTCTCDWADSEKGHRRRFGKLRNGAKTKAGPLEAEQLSRLGNIALVR